MFSNQLFTKLNNASVE